MVPKIVTRQQSDNKIYQSCEEPNVVDFSDDKLLSRHRQSQTSTIWLTFRELAVWRRRRLLIASSLFFAAAMFLTTLSVVRARQHLPDPTLHPPLPDLIVDRLPCLGWAMQAAECIMLGCIVVLAVIAFWHRQRELIFPRFFIIAGSTYLLRSLTISMTSLPATAKCSPLPCQPLQVSGPSEHLKLTFGLLLNIGLSTEASQQGCGDYLFSGHLTMLTLTCLFIVEYTPKRLLLHLTCLFVHLSGCFFVLTYHAHYTVDVVLAVVISTYVFQTYHIIARCDWQRRPEVAGKVKLWLPLLACMEETGELESTRLGDANKIVSKPLLNMINVGKWLRYLICTSQSSKTAAFSHRPADDKV